MKATRDEGHGIPDQEIQTTTLYIRPKNTTFLATLIKMTNTNNRIH